MLSLVAMSTYLNLRVKMQMIVVTTSWVYEFNSPSEEKTRLRIKVRGAFDRVTCRYIIFLAPL